MQSKMWLKHKNRKQEEIYPPLYVSMKTFHPLFWLCRRFPWARGDRSSKNKSWCLFTKYNYFHTHMSLDITWGNYNCLQRLSAPTIYDKLLYIPLWIWIRNQPQSKYPQLTSVTTRHNTMCTPFVPQDIPNHWHHHHHHHPPTIESKIS